MSCERYADALLETALGEPAPPELLGHLRSCAACREALERERGLVGRIDGELRDAVSVTPSPEFLPRVREGVAREADARRWTWSWLVPVAASVVALVAAFWLRQPPVPPAIQARSTAPSVAPRVAESPRAVLETRGSKGEFPKPIVQGPRTQRARTEPEVLVPPGEEELVRLFVVALRTRRADETAVLAGVSEPGSADLTIPLLEEIPQIEMKPLTSGIDPEGVDR